VLVQITTSSILGQMGSKAQKMAHHLLANRWVHFVSTDAHNLKSRPPKMRAAHDLVARKYGTGYAHSLCTANPQAAFDGSALPEQEEPRHLFDEYEGAGQAWWKKIFK
jgi:protein-tyrosine phosphatase